MTDPYTNPKYDFNGNTWMETFPTIPALASQAVSPDATHQDQYDFEKRLIQRSSASSTITIVYDGDGNRIWKTTPTETRYYLVDDKNPTGFAQVIEELLPNGSGKDVTRICTHGLCLISESLKNGSSWDTSYYGYDGHGNVRFLLSQAGGITDTYTYDAFGVLIARAGASENNYLYCGEQFDFDLGCYYLRARYVNPNTGRFWSQDNAEGSPEEPQSLHLYLYCQNDPANNTDPSGNDMEGMLAVMDIDSMFAAMLSPVASLAINRAAPVEYKFRVVSDHHLGTSLVWPPYWSGVAGGAWIWGQPSSCADGDYSIGSYTASAWVSVHSRNNSGGACNTIDDLDPTGTIILYMKCAVPGSVTVSANVRMNLSGSGPQNGPTAKLDSQGKTLFHAEYNGGVDVQEDNPYIFSANVGKTWTPVLKFIPTISFTKDNGRRSTGRAAAAIILHTFHK